eukprot:6871477-Ditylum_brightwellii.AAC.1
MRWPNQIPQVVIQHAGVSHSGGYHEECHVCLQPLKKCNCSGVILGALCGSDHLLNIFIKRNR